jgi:hypothetical protein
VRKKELKCEKKDYIQYGIDFSHLPSSLLSQDDLLTPKKTARKAPTRTSNEISRKELSIIYLYVFSHIL